jgi:TRAP-type C4-dicarboxylate transport system permease small subunit
MAGASRQRPDDPPIAGWLRRRADDVAVALIATMFVSFLLQIVFRYVLNRPLGWTEEVTVLCWVWVVLWGASFIVADADEVRFDILYHAVSPGVRRVFTIVASLTMIVLITLSLPATWRYVAFMKREHSAYLQMRFDYLYSIYLIFAVVCILRQARLAWLAWRVSRTGNRVARPDTGP